MTSIIIYSLSVISESQLFVEYVYTIVRRWQLLYSLFVYEPVRSDKLFEPITSAYAFETC